jgi:hypothetical protein
MGQNSSNKGFEFETIEPNPIQKGTNAPYYMFHCKWQSTCIDHNLEICSATLAIGEI